MTGCVFCSAYILRTGDRWYKARVADVNGFCPKSPDDDLHHAAAETETQRPESRL